MSVAVATPPRRPFFLITIDTEGDNLWAGPRQITTRNAQFLQRFQDLCESYALRPTYLTNYEMVGCNVFRRFARRVVQRGAAEIGMHLHAWNNPPAFALSDGDYAHLPYLVEYPDEVMRQKIRVVTAELEDAFGRKMVSHRAGRWNMDARYAAMLADEGYLVDCSVTPLVSWREYLGHPRGRGGADYRAFPSGHYFMDMSDISRPGASPLLEVPMTIVDRQPGPLSVAYASLKRTARDVVRSFTGEPRPAFHRPVAWLRPDGGNRRDLLNVVDRVQAEGRPYAEFMLHSSELMPGGSPTFRTEASIERLYSDLHALFAHVRKTFVGATLGEFHAAALAVAEKA